MRAVIEGYSFSTNVIALGPGGGLANSAREAETIYCVWTFHNSSSHPVDLVFPAARFFELSLLDDAGGVVWTSAAPAPGNDYTVTVQPGGNCVLPVNPPPAGVPLQSPMVPLSDIVANQAIPPTRDLHVMISIPIVGREQRVTTRLWR